MTEALAIADKAGPGIGHRGAVDQAGHQPWLVTAAPAFGESLALEMLGFLGPDAGEGLAALRERRAPNFPSTAELR